MFLVALVVDEQADGHANEQENAYGDPPSPTQGAKDVLRTQTSALRIDLGLVVTCTILRTVTAAKSDARSAQTRSLRILWLIKGLAVGGAERLLLLQAGARDRNLVSPTVAYLLPEQSNLVAALAREGVAAHCLGSRSRGDLRWTPALRRLLRDGDFDVVHVHSPLAAIGCRIVVGTLPQHRRPGIVVTEHNVWASHTRATRWADRLTQRRDEVHFAVSSAVRESLPSAVRSRTTVLRHGIDVEAVRSAASARTIMREELGIAPGELLVGTVANLRRTKGYPDLIRAARDVLDTVPNVRFVAVGQGPLERELRALACELGVGDRFELLGHRPDAVPVMSAFDVFCLPSRHEGLPISLMEALALGLPIVATRAGGIGELVSDGGEGLLAPPGRPDCLAHALIRVLRDDGRRSDMARCAYARGAGLGIGQTVNVIETAYRHLARA
jgi:glycosyltransferase involved in cell wall biosynthesis